MMKRIVSLLMALAMLLSVSAMAEATYPVEGEGSLTFVSTEPNTLNMIQSASNLDTDVFYLTSAMLYRPYNGNVYPELAADCTVSSDNLVYTYTLKDAVYTDGTPITAADFAYYMVQTLDGASAVYYKNGEKFLAGECTAEEVGIYTKDDKTLVVELESGANGYISPDVIQDCGAYEGIYSTIAFTGHGTVDVLVNGATKMLNAMHKEYLDKAIVISST